MAESDRVPDAQRLPAAEDRADRERGAGGRDADRGAANRRVTDDRDADGRDITYQFSDLLEDLPGLTLQRIGVRCGQADCGREGSAELDADQHTTVLVFTDGTTLEIAGLPLACRGPVTD